jgi:hypothetical protein
VYFAWVGGENMENYTMQPNEVVLCKGDASVGTPSVSERAHIQLMPGIKEVMLTNVNIVIISKTKKLFKPEEVSVTTYPVSDIKVYDEKPQVKVKGNTVEVYMTNDEISLQFMSLLLARKFASEVYTLLTGKSASERGANMFKGAIDLVDNTLGIDSVNTIKGVVENGVVGSVVSGIGKKAKKVEGSSTSKKLISGAYGVVKDALSEKDTNAATVPSVGSPAQMSVDEQIEAIKKLKELLDSGVLTQEEFDAKKKQVLGL